MTSTLIFGFFPLISGSVSTTQRKNTQGVTTHIEYNSFLTTGEIRTPCKLRVWVPPSTAVLRPNTVAFLVGKMHAPPGQTVLIEVHTFHPVPGDPASDTYEDSIPDFNSPWVVVLGHASSGPTTLADGVSRGFTLTASEYIRGAPLAAPYHARFSGNTSRWNNTPAPHLNTAAQVYGSVIESTDGVLNIDISNITLNIGPVAAAQSAASAQPGSAATSPAKKRRFQVELSAPSGAVVPAPNLSSTTASSSGAQVTTQTLPPVSASDDDNSFSVQGEDDVSVVDESAPNVSAKARGKRRAPAS